MSTVAQTKGQRDLVRKGALLPEFRSEIDEVYYKHGLPGVVIWAHNREARIHGELERIDARIGEIDGSLRILLGLRLLEAGHATNLGEAIDIAEHLDKVRELEPEWFPADDEWDPRIDSGGRRADHPDFGKF